MAAQLAFESAARNAALARVHEKMVNDALMIWVVHDVGPRAMSPRSRASSRRKNWFQDLTPVSVGEWPLSSFGASDEAIPIRQHFH